MNYEEKISEVMGYVDTFHLLVELSESFEHEDLDEVYEYFDDLIENDVKLKELLLEDGNTEIVNGLYDTIQDYRKARTLLHELYQTLVKYNRRIDNSIDDLWEIFLQNTTQNPMTILSSEIERIARIKLFKQ